VLHRAFRLRRISRRPRAWLVGALAALSLAQPAFADVETSAPKARPRAGKALRDDDTLATIALDIGPLWFRKVEDTTPRESVTNFERGTGEVALGSTSTAAYGPFYVAGSGRTILRSLDAKSFAWSIYHQDLAGGLRLGPLEPEARFGVSVLTVDVFRAEWSAELLSPRVSFGVGVHIGRVRVDVRAHAEYLWRWFGPDYLVRGLTLGVRLDVPRLKD
jgi:hypothetical protein